MRVGLDPARPQVDVCRFRRYGFAMCFWHFFMHVAVLDVRELCCCFGLYVVVIGRWHIGFKTHHYFVSPPVDLLRWVFCAYGFDQFVAAVAGNVITARSTVFGSRT